MTTYEYFPLLPPAWPARGAWNQDLVGWFVKQPHTLCRARSIEVAARRPGSEGFVRARGGRLIERVTMAGLDLAEIDRRALEHLEAPGPANAGYTLVR